MVGLKRAGSPALSFDDRFVAYTVRDTDWVGNAFVTQIWLADTQTGETRQITQGKKSNTSPAWSPDAKKLAFVSERGDKRQVYVLDMGGGDAVQITSADEGVSRFAWSPDGRQIAYSAMEPKSKALKDREAQDGDIELVGEDHRMTHLWVIDVESKHARQITSGAYNVGGFRWAPDGARIAFDHQINADLGADSTADIAVVTVADSQVREIVTQPGPDVNPVWSPDGQSIAFETTMSAPWHYYANSMIAVVAAGGGTPVPLTRDFDEDVSITDWTRDGIWFGAAQHTATALFHLDPGSRRIEKHSPAADWVGSGFSLDKSGANVACVWSDPRHYPEIGIAPTATMQVKTLTRLGDQLKGWPLGTTEVVRWTSRDGAAIEGVLHKPAGWTAGARRPLMVVIHGGPTAVSRPNLFSSTYVYPVERWVAKGALVLEPNYRGSAGYGGAFRALNVRNLGVGDAWDVMSSIDALIARGIVDSTRVGVCGWSEGGYISAFLATHESTRFRAISVGAGISDWMTYYVNTDITPFTRQYLHATPWDDPEIYARTSPITTVKSARTPTLIQHGSEDARVPTPDAYELYRALEDVGVTARLAIYKGFGHGINKPKQIRAAMRHNLEWFNRYLWGEGVGKLAVAAGGTGKSAAKPATQAAAAK
ncbi:MAG: S9 family peptidase [Candidatus Eisenbacteria bacterium]|nr:S9 family peptidase [Candidatus Eisenbacteria bacterium]